MAANWFLQPLGARMDRVHTKYGRDAMPADYQITLVCDTQAAPDLKMLIARALPAPVFQLRALHTSAGPNAARQTELRADYTTAARDDEVAEDAIRTLGQHPNVTSARWTLADEHNCGSR